MQMLRSYQLLVTWQALRKKAYLPLMMAVQTLFSLGIVLGYPLLFPTLDRTSIYLIATGAPAISMISVGLVALPQTVGEQKSEGSPWRTCARCWSRAWRTSWPTSPSGWRS
jgi:ABC-2 type transport system permease protein